MQAQTGSNSRSLAAFAAMLAAAALIGLGLAGWLDSGARMFMALAEAGLAWCF